MTRYRIAGREDVPEGESIVVDAGTQRLALCNVGGQFYAIDDLCTHDGGPLGEGVLFGEEIECPRHGARFDVRTGRVTRMPAVRPVKTYAVSVSDDGIYVDVDDDW